MTDTIKRQLFSNETTNTSTGQFGWPGGTGNLDGRGTFGGGSVALEYIGADGNWQPVSGGAVSAAGVVEFTMGACAMRATISGGTGHDIDAAVYFPR